MSQSCYSPHPHLPACSPTFAQTSSLRPPPPHSHPTPTSLHLLHPLGEAKMLPFLCNPLSTYAKLLPSAYTSQDNRRGTRPYLVHFRFCTCSTRHAIGWLPGGHLQDLQHLRRSPHHLGPRVPTVMRPPSPTGLPWRPLMARPAFIAGVASVD